MTFINGGTLADYIKTWESRTPAVAFEASASTLETGSFTGGEDVETMLKILTGVAHGMEYLHCREPMPVLHRDIKSENILLTDDLQPRIADLGEARALAEDRAMTAVGTNGYTAPEVLRGVSFWHKVVYCSIIPNRKRMNATLTETSFRTRPSLRASPHACTGALRHRG